MIQEQITSFASPLLSFLFLLCERIWLRFLHNFSIKTRDMVFFHLSRFFHILDKPDHGLITQGVKIKFSLVLGVLDNFS